jgi:hypothetical protein
MGAKKSAAPIPLDPTPDCSVALSGAVQGSFGCKVDVRPSDGKGLRIVFTPKELPKEIGAFLWMPMKVPAPARTGTTYTGDQLKDVRVALSGPEHRTYLASGAGKDGKGARGFVTLKLDKVSVEAHEASANGTVTARLLPDGNARGDVLVTVKF